MTEFLYGQVPLVIAPVVYRPWPADGTVVYASNTSTPPTWVPCGACGGSGGGLRHVTWAVAPVWISCAFCGGGGGRFTPG